jgi:aldose 1-epimerase
MRNGLPSGEQIEIAAGDQRAVVVEVGAGPSLLHRGRPGGPRRLRRRRDGERRAGGRCSCPGRTGSRTALTSSEAPGTTCRSASPRRETRSTASFAWLAWSVAERDGDRVVLEHTSHPQPGYPFSLALGIEYALTDEGLRVTSSATNIGDRACPYGSGQHPYVTLGAESVDTLLCCAPGTDCPVRRRRGGYRQGPNRSRGPSTTSGSRGRSARRSSTTLSPISSETTTGVPGWSSGIRTGGVRSRLARRDLRYLQLFTGDPLPSVGRRSLAVEPMTCAPNAFRTGAGLLVLEPGESTTAEGGSRGERPARRPHHQRSE